MASTCKSNQIECAAPANAGAVGVARVVPSDILYCGACGRACGTVLDAGFDPRLHGMAMRHAARAGPAEGTIR